MIFLEGISGNVNLPIPIAAQDPQHVPCIDHCRNSDEKQMQT